MSKKTSDNKQEPQTTNKQNNSQNKSNNKDSKPTAKQQTGDNYDRA